LLCRLRPMLDKIGNPEPRNACYRAGNKHAVQQLKHSNVGRRSLALRTRCRRCTHFVHQAFNVSATTATSAKGQTAPAVWPFALVAVVALILSTRLSMWDCGAAQHSTRKLLWTRGCQTFMQ